MDRNIDMPRGFPRPRTHIAKTYSNDGVEGGSFGPRWENRVYPHPYTAEKYNLARISYRRLGESIQNKICGTCGEPVEEDLVGIILVNPDGPTETGRITPDQRSKMIHSESGPYHLTCLVLNFTVCPMLAVKNYYIPAVALWDDVKQTIRDAYTNG